MRDPSHERILDYLHKVAIAVPKVGSGKLAAAVVYKGRVVSVGVNQAKTHPLQSKWNRNPHRSSLHAEVAAIIRCSRILNEDEIKKAALFVARSKKILGVDSPGMAKPCDGCLDLIIASGFKNLYFTTDDGFNHVKLH